MKKYVSDENLAQVVSKIQAKEGMLDDLKTEDKTSLVNAVNSLKSVIPTQASTNNQLADKEYVNSSIATSTATFRGTFDNIRDFPTAISDLNDYVFLKTIDNNGNRVYKRYKYNGSTWNFEYELNNSSFTAEQWSAINSGISSGKISEIEGLIASKANNTDLSNLRDALNIQTNKITTIEAELPTKATQIKASVDSTPIFYNVLGLKLLDKNNQEISSSKVYLPKAQEALHTSTFIFEEEDSTCRVEGELAGKSREEKMSIFPYNLMREEEVQLQDSNGVDLEGKDKFIVMPNLWLKTSVGEDGTTWSITFANQKVDNDYFRAYDDDSINEVLIAKYKASDDGTHLRSVSGEYPRVNLNQTNADNMLPYYNGKKVDSFDYRVKMLYDLLACCFIENRNAQNVYVGMTSYPWGDGNLINQVGEIGKNGSTDSLGKLATGEITTFNETALASGRRPVSILGVENPYGLLWENMSGAVHDSNAKLFLYEGLEHMTPAMMTPSDSNPYYKDVGVTLSTTEGWQKTFTNYKGYFYPKGVGGNSVNGVGDYYWVNLGGWRIFFVGGDWSAGSGCGLFSLAGSNDFGRTLSSIGFRLSLKR